MLDRNDDRTITANVDEVLTALRANLAEHKEIVAEARLGYVAKAKKFIREAQEKLEARLAKLDAGDPIPMPNLSFNISLPEDHSKEFNTVIKMLELHKNAWKGQYVGDSWHDIKPATIELKAADVQRFVLNDWTWMDNFLIANSVYSGKSRAIAADKGLM